jgi:hypothetical protein
MRADSGHPAITAPAESQLSRSTIIADDVLAAVHGAC